MVFKKKRLSNIGAFRRALLLAVAVIFVLTGSIIIYQYIQYQKFENRLNNTYKRLSPNTAANQLLLEFSKAETAFRLYTLSFDSKAYGEYIRQIGLLKQITDSLASLPIRENPITHSPADINERNLLAAEYAQLKKNMDELILHTKDTVNIAHERPATVPGKVKTKKVDSVIKNVVREQTTVFRDTLVREKKGFFRRVKNLFSPQQDTTFVTFREKQNLTTEQASLIQDNVDDVLQEVNTSYQEQMQKAKQQLMQVRQKERQLIAVNYALLNSFKAGLDKIRDEELTAQREAEKRDFTAFKQNTDIFSNQLIIALSLMLIMLVVLAYYQSHANRAERELVRQKEYADAIAEEKTAVLASISHEIRTPLNAVMGVVDMLKNSHQQVKPDDNLIQSAYYSIKIITNTIDDVLSLNYLETEQTPVTTGRFRPHQQFHHTLDLFQHLANLKGLKLIREINIDPHLQVESDEPRLKQIISNLMSNAIKYTRTGSVYFRAGIDHNKGTHVLKLEIEDEGSGIPDEAREHIFRKYFRADAETAMSGTGLGLYIVKLLTGQLGGSIDFNSTSAKGTVFYVSIPVMKLNSAAADNMGKEKPENRISLPADLSCLLVDDNPINILYLQHVLKKHISDIHTADNGLTAIKRLEEGDFRIVLTDITMPGMDGFELLRHIRRQAAWKDMLVFAISADSSLIGKQADPEYAFDGFVMKPFVEQDLVASIDAALKRRKTADIA